MNVFSDVFRSRIENNGGKNKSISLCGQWKNFDI
jgi:hypothetical protein